MIDQPQTTEPPWQTEPCPICGAFPGTDCAGDEGYGCPSWDNFKDEHSEYREDVSSNAR